MLEQEIFAYLSAYSGLTSLVDKRIYPLLVPQTAKLPAVSYKRISTVRAQSKDGPSGLVEARFDFACWGKSYADAKSVAEQVRNALSQFVGSDGEANTLLNWLNSSRRSLRLTLKKPIPARLRL